MDLRVYDLFQDPVFVYQSNRQVIYVNPMAMRWSGWPKEVPVQGALIEKFIVFQGTNIVSAGARLGDFQSRPYTLVQLHIPNKGHDSVAKASVQKIPLANNDYLTVLVIRERGFIEILMDEEDAPVSDEDTSTLTNENFILGDLKASDTQVLNRPPEMTITNAINNDRSARLESRCNIQILDPLKVALAGDTLFLSDNWIEVAVYNAQIPVGAKASIEILPSAGLRSFTARAIVVKQDQSPSGQIILRFQFESLGALVRKSITELLDKSAIKI